MAVSEEQEANAQKRRLNQSETAARAASTDTSRTWRIDNDDFIIISTSVLILIIAVFVIVVRDGRFTLAGVRIASLSRRARKIAIGTAPVVITLIESTGTAIITIIIGRAFAVVAYAGNGSASVVVVALLTRWAGNGHAAIVLAFLAQITVEIRVAGS